jgi:hypothetical protein
MYKNYTEDEEDKLGEKLETGDPVLFRGLLLNPRTNNHETKYTYETLYGEEYEKPKQNFVKGFHLV